ncbi:hypothetical protein [Frankia sp. Cj3]|uniref:hypothetical protein n=1 Tax=Frankia sp. Cj3 TaxID=2880976 RepID=UPI001EF66072|nr:hypothetical protein [Frankia sp. Cj3]
METDSTGVIEAARAIRPYLPRLLAPAAAHALDQRLAAELTSPADPVATARQLRVLLDGQEDTAWFLAAVLRDAPDYRPPYHQPQYLSRQPPGGRAIPPGDPGPVGGAARFACPQGDYVWYRPDVATPVPACPTHQTPLVRG